MENIVLQTIGNLDRALKEKVKELRERDEPDLERTSQTKKRLTTLRETLHNTVDEAMNIVEEKVDGLTDPVRCRKKEIDEIQNKLRKETQLQQKTRAQTNEQRRALVELRRIEAQI